MHAHDSHDAIEKATWKKADTWYSGSIVVALASNE
jgi:hypothetical protein